MITSDLSFELGLRLLLSQLYHAMCICASLSWPLSWLQTSARNNDFSSMSIKSPPVGHKITDMLIFSLVWACFYAFMCMHWCFLVKNKPVMRRKPIIEIHESPRWWVLIKPSAIKDRSRTDLGHDAQRRIISWRRKLNFNLKWYVGLTTEFLISSVVFVVLQNGKLGGFNSSIGRALD